MGSSFIGFRGGGFWMRDAHLELWLRLLALHIEDPSKRDPNPTATKIRDRWLLASRGFFNGCIPIDLEEDAATPEGEAIVRKAIDSLMRAVAAAPDAIDKGALNLLGFKADWGVDVEKWRLIDIGRAFTELLDGKIKTVVKDTAAFMPGMHRRTGP